MLNSETIIVSPSCKKLALENYVVGYKKEGESIVVLFKQDNDILFSIVIDSYEKNENETIKILKERKVEIMLKIKDSVDLKELEKFGFVKTKNYAKLLIWYPKGNSGNCRYFSSIRLEEETRKINFNLENMSFWCNSLEELDDDFENIKYSYESFKKIINDLIKADMVEKVEE